jgi:hypothetical protein
VCAAHRDLSAHLPPEAATRRGSVDDSRVKGGSLRADMQSVVSTLKAEVRSALQSSLIARRRSRVRDA